MFATIPTLNFNFNFQQPNPDPNPTNLNLDAHSYAPLRSSPLSPRRDTPELQSQQQQQQSPYAQRYLTKISNPLTQPSHSYKTSSSPSARAKRRDLFLNRVKRDREAGRFEERGEQLMRIEFVAEREKWGELMRRDAQGVFWGLDDGVDYEEEEVEEDIHALDEYISQERAMEMAILEQQQQMKVPQTQTAIRNQNQNHSQLIKHNNHDDSSSSFSDEEYEGIFMDLADPTTTIHGHDQSMDMSSG